MQVITQQERFWSKLAEPGSVKNWSRKAKRKRVLWKGVTAFSEFAKRCLDLFGSLFAILLFSPIFIGTALLIKLEDRGPILFMQKRVGIAGRLFDIWKFRSMSIDAEKRKTELSEQNQHSQGVTFKMKDDPRITKVGKWIRKLSVDEFPQFFNVIKGDMSLVGPRPPVPSEVAKYEAFHLRRLKVKPGITCLWQIGGRSQIDFEGQVRLDLEYIHSQSIWRDIKILVLTVPAIIFGTGAY